MSNVEPLGAGRIEGRELEQEMRSSFLDYAMSVIVARALPDVRDGLKPVHRRVLYAMHEAGLQPNRPRLKCARVVGDVMGAYHPHGDVAIYDTLGRMAQPFSLRDIDADTVDFEPNYDESRRQPTVLPARFPNLLVNGSAGIAVGMATNIPSHNLGEVIDALVAMIDDADIDVDRLTRHIKGPDFPTGGIILGREGIREAYRSGRGRIVMRARAHIEELRGGRTAIVVTELPYGVRKGGDDGVIAKIADLVKEDTLKEVADLKDLSDKSGMRVEIHLKRDVVPQVALNKLYKHTPLQTTFGYNAVALVDGVPRTLSLRDMLQHYLDFQREVITRRSKYELRKAEARAHGLQGYLVARDNLDEELELEDLIAEEDMVIAITRSGYVKRLPVTTYREQRRGGIGVMGMDLKEDDYIEHLFVASTHDYILFFTSVGKVYRLKVHELPLGSRQSKGRAIVNLLPLAQGESVRTLIATRDFNEAEYLVLATKKGIVKKTRFEEYNTRLKETGIIAIRLRDDDELVAVLHSSGDDDILMVSRNGQAIRFHESEARPMGRATGGVIGMKLRKGDDVIAASLAKNDADLLVVTQNGF